MLIEKVFAQVDTTTSDPVTRFQNLADIFGFAINVALGIGWALVFIMLALGFIQYILSKGEKAAVDSAQKWLTYAVIGGIGLFFLSFVRRIVPTLLTGSNTAPANSGNIVNF